MSASILRLYYNRKSAPMPRHQAISELSSKLDRSDAPFVMNDVPNSPFALDLKFAPTEDESNFCESSQDNKFKFSYLNMQRPISNIQRNFSTRVMEQDNMNWKQQMTMRCETAYHLNNQHSSYNSHPSSVSFEEAKTGSQERGSARIPTSRSPPLQSTGASVSPSSQAEGLSTEHLVSTLQVLSDRGDWNGCMNIMRNPSSSSGCDMQCYQIALRCCSDASGQSSPSAGQVFSATPADEAMWLLQEMRSRFVADNEATSSDMVLLALRALARGGRPVEALQLFQEQGESYGRALTHALHACALASKESWGHEKKWVETSMQILYANKKKAKLNHYNIVLSALAGGGHLKQAVEFVDDMRAKTRFKADSYTWSTLLWACATSQSLAKEGEPDGALVAMEIFSTLRKSEPQSVNAHVFAAAIRAVTGVTGPSYPPLPTLPEEIRVDHATGQALTLDGFEMRYGLEDGVERWESCEATNAVGMWRAMIAAGYAPPSDVTTGVLLHARHTRGTKAAHKVALELGREWGRGWRAENILDDVCFGLAMEILREMNDKVQLKKLAALRIQLLKDRASKQ